MAWYHQYQYAEIKSARYITLRGKSLPIVSYEITDDPKRILAVKLEICRDNFQWFNRSDVTLFKSGVDLITMPEQRHNENIVKRLCRSLNMRRFFS